MKTKTKWTAVWRRRFGLVAGLLAILGSGCATHDLWCKSVFAPAYPARLELFQSEQHADILVSYQERKVPSSRERARTYFLFANTNNVAEYRKPAFLKQPDFTNWSPIPVLGVSSAANLASPSGSYAIISPTNRVEFTLYRNSECLGRFRLPGYEAMSGVGKRTLLTPFAVGLDAATALVIGIGSGP